MIKPTYLPKEKRWKYRYTYYDNQGIRREKVFSSSKEGIEGKNEVLAKFRAWQGDTFQFVWEKYLEDKTYRLGSDSKTLKNDESVGRLYLLPAFADTSINNLKIHDYQMFINKLKLKNGASPTQKYLRNITCTLSAFLAWAWTNSYLTEPLRGKFYLPKGHSVKGKEIPTMEEFKKMCVPTNLHYQAYILFLFVTGCRPSEALYIRKSDIVSGVAYIKGGILNDGSISRGKTKNSHRAVPLCNLALKQVNVMAERFPDSEWVFCNKSGGPVKQKNAYRQLKKLCKKSGISKNLSLYSARHFFISHTSKDLGLQATQHTVGHSASMDTISTYTHSTNEELLHIQSTLNSIFG